MKSSDPVIDASLMSSVLNVLNKEGSESQEMFEPVDRMLAYRPPPQLTAEMGEAVDEVISILQLNSQRFCGIHGKSVFCSTNP